MTFFTRPNSRASRTYDYLFAPARRVCGAVTRGGGGGIPSSPSSPSGPEVGWMSCPSSCEWKRSVMVGQAPFVPAPAARESVGFFNEIKLLHPPRTTTTTLRISSRIFYRGAPLPDLEAILSSFKSRVNRGILRGSSSSTGLTFEVTFPRSPPDFPL